MTIVEQNGLLFAWFCIELENIEPIEFKYNFGLSTRQQINEVVESGRVMNFLKLTRRTFLQLAQIRQGEANLLLKGKQYSGAYYLCGYAIECGLKACIAKQTHRYDFPDKDTVLGSYTHSLIQLVRIAGLQQELDDESDRDKSFEQNWATVKEWRETSRYQKLTRQDAEALYEATTNNEHGVMQWIRRHW